MNFANLENNLGEGIMCETRYQLSDNLKSNESNNDFCEFTSNNQ